MPQSLNITLLLLLFFINIFAIYIIMKSVKADKDENINAELIYINHVINNLRRDLDSANENLSNIKDEYRSESDIVKKHANNGLNDLQIAKITNKSVREIELIKKLNLNRTSSTNNKIEGKK